MRAVIVAAHPDDEILGVGTLMPSLRNNVAIIHITDGAPRSGSDAQNAGCVNWQEYAARRRRELREALASAGAPNAEALCLDCPDQMAFLRIAGHARRLAALMDQLRPSLVFTHAYEGGHPDHDATAAAVHAARRLRKQDFVIAEFAGYHAGKSRMLCECFLDKPPRADARPLSEEQRGWKQEVLSCFVSQAGVLAQFPLRYEPLRIAPRYDFTQPAHPGQLYYQRFDWAPDPAKWRRLACLAFESLSIPCVC